MKMFVKRNLAVITAFLVVVGTFITGAVKINAASGDTIVYITKTGEKYHNAGCGSLSKSKIETTLQSAVDRGYEPCKKCKPPKLDTTSSESVATTNVAAPTKVNKSTATKSATTTNALVEALKTYKGNTEEFNAYTYYINYVDLQTAIGADGDKLLKHYNEYGKAEGRVAK